MSMGDKAIVVADLKKVFRLDGPSVPITRYPNDGEGSNLVKHLRGKRWDELGCEDMEKAFAMQSIAFLTLPALVYFLPGIVACICTNDTAWGVAESLGGVL